MHVEEDHGTGGHWCAKLIFFVLLSVLVGLVAMIVLESRGIKDVSVADEDSRFSQYFEGWVEEPKDHGDDHDDVLHAIHSHEETFDEEEIDDHNVSQEGSKLNDYYWISILRRSCLDDHDDEEDDDEEANPEASNEVANDQDDDDEDNDDDENASQPSK